MAAIMALRAGRALGVIELGALVDMKMTTYQHRWRASDENMLPNSESDLRCCSGPMVFWPDATLFTSVRQRCRMQQPRSTLTPDYQRDWPAYFDAVAGQPARDTCLRALAACAECARMREEDFVAFDLACGEGRDTRAMLASDSRWRVVALDASVEGLSRLRRSLGADGSRVRVEQVALEEVPARCDADRSLPRHAQLVNASFALPFCHEDRFSALWEWIGRMLAGDGERAAGVFAGQFFGDRDEWAAVNQRRHVSRARLLELLAEWHILHLEEVEKEGSDAMGGSKRHHVFHVVARARAV
jgi:hypothetical protein